MTVTEILLLAIAAAILIAAIIYVSRPGTTVSSSSLTPVRVAPSQTLWAIAEAYPIEGLSTADTVAFIRDANDLRTSSLSPGQTLFVHETPPEEAVLASR